MNKKNRTLHILAGAAAILVSLCPVLPSSAMDHSRAGEGYTKSIVEYTVPDITLINQTGKPIKLAEYLNTDKTVVLEFIFSTCTTICPILTLNFTTLQQRLDTELDTVRMISISIDPEHDTPALLNNYLQKYNAKPGWDFFTGRVEDVTQVMKAFNAHVSDKMGHRPLIFLHAPHEKKWVRLDGLMSGEELLAQYRMLKRQALQIRHNPG
ncbi:MAG: SCO family protein [Desulfobulbus sp.]|nr:MAG: SCO family protein [Desulfobulbus sp.]